MQDQQHAGGLSGAGVLRHLMRTGLLDPAEAVGQGCTAVDNSMSHRSVLVTVGAKPRFFAKQADHDRSGGRDLQVEKRFHVELGALPSLRDLVPRCHGIANNGTTMLMHAPDAAPLELTTLLCLDPKYASRRWTRDVASQALVRQYGNAVARVHAIRTPPLGPAPWLLQPLEPVRLAAAGAPDHPGQGLMWRLANSAGYRAAFRRARLLWTPTGLIHGDLRCANVLHERNSVSQKVWLVDWELACHGDRAWDVAAVVAEMLASALLWHPMAEPWSAVERSAGVFLAGYRDAWNPSQGAWHHLLHRTVPFAGVRLVQTLLEIGHGDPDEYRRSETHVMPWVDLFLSSSVDASTSLAAAAASAGRT